MIKVVIADDSLSIRRGVRAMLEHTPGFTIVGEACNGQEAIDLIEKLSPDVLILDLTMPVMDGITALITLRQRGSNVPILILSAHDDWFSVLECLNNGAHGYILKEEAPEFLPEAIQLAAQGKDGLNSPKVQNRYKSSLDKP
jgi:DNA-binding NarL/FixJ family response regulator